METAKTPHEQQEPPEFFPTIIVDTALNEHLSHLDVDLHAINETFIENGMTSDQVSETTIHIVGSERNVGGMVIYGCYTKKKQQIELFPVRKIDQRIRSYQKSVGDAREFSKEYEGKYLGYTLGEVLRHEMEHRIVHTQGGMREQQLHKRRMRTETAGILATFAATNFVAINTLEAIYPSQTLTELAAKQLGSTLLLGIATLKANLLRSQYFYKTSPEENRAYDAQEPEIGEHWPFITLRLKFQDE